MERLLGFDLQLLQDAFITGVNIFILFFALSYLLFNPARELLEKRRTKIAGQLSDAAGDREAAGKLKVQYEDRLKHIQKEADQILDHAREMAKERQAKILREAREEAEAVMERAGHEIALEKEKVMEDIKQEVVNMATMMACKAVTELLGQGLQRQLIDATVKEMGERSWPS